MYFIIYLYEEKYLFSKKNKYILEVFIWFSILVNWRLIYVKYSFKNLRLVLLIKYEILFCLF